eukprot:TRINITY_DN6778_c0_g1_i1.p1 TRINITY_DN6778_c0_g1~~TRINITY_DN6778_c0_g1_i1.p1  ORF type:complete len:568 (+),score=135.98 TRINITY_DN6778_c0_g1_i1:46-1749(+)
MPAKMDPARRAHIERIMERRRKEGRSSVSRSSTTEGRLGNVVPAVFPPESGYSGVSPEPNHPVSSPHSEAVSYDQESLDRQRQEILKIREETRKELDKQRAISAQSENQLKWQQQQLEQQLNSQKSVDERLHDRAMKYDDKDDELERRIRERERGMEDRQTATLPPTTESNDTNRALADKVADLERKLKDMQQPSPVPPRSTTADPYEVSVRRAGPSAASTIYDNPNNFMKPGHTTNPPRHAENLNDPIFSKNQPPAPPAAPWISSSYSPPRDTPPFTVNLGPNKANKDPVWESQAPINARAAREDTWGKKDDTWGRRDDSYNQGAPQPHQQQQHQRQQQYPMQGEQSGYAPQEQSHHHASPPRYQQQLESYQHQYNGQQGNSSYQLGTGLGGGSPAGGASRRQVNVNLQLHRESILHDMKNGDVFIKWTKNDKPHLRWFWLNQKKLLLLWSNTQSASILMSNNIRLEEVVSIKAEQLTEESPGDPGHPQVYYLMTVTTYKRQLQMACQNREKFNRWFEGLTLLTQQYRQANEVAYAQAANPAMSRVLSRQAMQSRSARNATVTAAD